MRGTIGAVLFLLGLYIFISVIINQNSSSWISEIIGVLMILFGLGFLIEERLKEFKEEIMNEIEDR